LLFALAVLQALGFSQAARPRVPCAGCHTQGVSQPSTSMAHAAETSDESLILSTQPLLTLTSGRYSYRIERRGAESIYSVSDGKQTLEIPIAWAVGAGRIGQTYVFRKDGVYYESQVSYFSAIKGLDITIGHQDSKPTNLLEAAGKPVGDSAIANCFNCHATNAVANGKLANDKLLPGVRCERCHTAAAKHLAGLSEGELDLPEMKKLTVMPPDDLLNFNGPGDPNTVRFAPYRLTLSKCYDLEDKRITCTACHDPHQEVGHDKVDYDSKCLACHGGGKAAAHVCKVAKQDCVSCHMPKVSLPGAHHEFTDHFIRVAKETR
jgi:hypothetical protein